MIDYKDSNQKKVDKGKNWIKIIGFFLIAVVFSSTVFASIYFYTKYTDKYSILKYVVIGGNKILSSKQIRNITLTNNAIAMDRYKEKDIYSKLMLNPWIKEARVAKIYPDTIYIKIKERKPCGILLFKNNVFLVDSDGNIIDRYQKTLNIKPDLLPHIVLKNSMYMKENFLIKSILKIYEKLDKFDKINYIEVISDSYQLVHFSNSLNVVVNSLHCPDVAFGHLKKEWLNLVNKKDRLESVSICFSNKFVLRWKKEKKSGGSK